MPWDNIAFKQLKVLVLEEIYMQSEQDKEQTKQAYEKPRLRMIELAAEEVLATGCKTFSGDLSGVGGSPGGGCVVSPCSSVPGT